MVAGGTFFFPLFIFYWSRTVSIFYIMLSPAEISLMSSSERGYCLLPIHGLQRGMPCHFGNILKESCLIA